LRFFLPKYNVRYYNALQIREHFSTLSEHLRDIFKSSGSSESLCYLKWFATIVSSEVLPTAFELLERCKFREQDPDRAQVTTFLTIFPDYPPLPEVEFSLKTSMALLAFHNLVENFTLGFATERLGIITQHLHCETYVSSTTSLNASLRRIGKLRLSRAFYHLELYGLLFCPSRYVHDVDTITGQPAEFFGHMNEVQLESFLCIRTFLLERLQNSWTKLKKILWKNL